MTQPANLFTDGEAYERLMGRWSQLAGDKFIDWLEPPDGFRWLDVGCGNGAFTERLAERCSPSEVVGIDASAEQLAYARERLAAHRVLFREGDAHDLPFDDKSFDAAAMALVITLVSDPAKAVAELARVVRPGGLVATYMWDIPDGRAPLSPVYSAMDSVRIDFSLPPNNRYSTRDALIALWKVAGLQSIDTTVIQIPVRFRDFDEFWASIAGGVGPVGKAIEVLEAEKVEALRLRLRNQFETSTDGSVSYGAFANAVKGRVPG